MCLNIRNKLRSSRDLLAKKSSKASKHLKSYFTGPGAQIRILASLARTSLRALSYTTTIVSMLTFSLVAGLYFLPQDNGETFKTVLGTLSSMPFSVIYDTTHHFVFAQLITCIKVAIVFAVLVEIVRMLMPVLSGDSHQDSTVSAASAQV